MAKQMPVVRESQYKDMTALEERRASIRANQQVKQQIDELKVRLVQITEQRMDYAVRILKTWYKEDGKAERPRGSF